VAHCYNFEIRFVKKSSKNLKTISKPLQTVSLSLDGINLLQSDLFAFAKVRYCHQVCSWKLA